MAEMVGIPLTGNITTPALLRQCVKPRHSDGYGCTIMLGGPATGGTIGGGTLSLYISPDKGVTFIPMQNASGTAMTLTAFGCFNATIFVGNSQRELGVGIYYTFTGSTSPNAKLWLSDNKG